MGPRIGAWRTGASAMAPPGIDPDQGAYAWFGRK
jgi:hypothetical protein